MTTEQMDWLDDERAGRHAPPKQGEQPKGGAGDSGAADELDGDGFPRTGRFLDGLRTGRGRWPFTPNPADSVKPDFYEQIELARRDVADFMGVPIEAIQITLNHDVAEEHTHHTREARDQCAAGDHQYARLLDEAAEREKVLRHSVEADETKMADEPIENRLRRAWLNGFKDGVDRASYAATESTGRWDY